MNFDWTKVLGYQHERLHTGVMRWLIDNPSTRIRLHELLPILRGEGRIETKFEARGTDAKGVADLLLSRADRQAVIETKVDSLWTSDQLERERGSDPNTDVHLFTVGLLDLVTSECCVPEDVHWIGLERWLDVLTSLELPPALDDYVEALRRQRDLHARAREAAFEKPTAWRPSSRLECSAANWAWIGIVLQHLNDKRSWKRNNPISGPLLNGGWCEEDGEHYFLEFCTTWGQSRSIRIKAGSSSRERTSALRVAAAETIAKQEHGLKLLRRTGNYVALAEVCLDDCTAPEAAARAEELVHLVDQNQAQWFAAARR